MNEPAVRHIEHDAQDATRSPVAMGQPSSTPMVERTFRLLDIVSASDEGMTFSELARALAISKGSLHGLLKALERTQVVEQGEGRRYALGPRIQALALAHSQHAGLRRFALPSMERLAATLGETVLLGRVAGDSVRIVARSEPENDPSALHISAAPGTQVPLLAAALGRVVLASWPAAQRDAYLRAHPLPRFTQRSITDPDVFLASVTETATTGIGLDREEYLTGVNAVAVSIRGLGGPLSGVLWVVGFAARLDDEAMRRAGELLRDEADAVARALAT